MSDLDDVIVEGMSQTATNNLTDPATLQREADRQTALDQEYKRHQAEVTRLGPATLDFLQKSENAYRIANEPKEWENLGLLEKLYASWRTEDVDLAAAARNAVDTARVPDFLSGNELTEEERQQFSAMGVDIPAATQWVNKAMRDGAWGDERRAEHQRRVWELADAAKRRQEYTTPKLMEELSAAKTFGGAFNTFMKDPLGLMAFIGTSSIASQWQYILGAMPAYMVGGPLAGAAVTGAGSYRLDRAAGLLQGLSEAGVDLTDTEAVRAYLSDPSNVQRMIESANSHAEGVAAFDFLAGLLAPVQLTAFARAAGTARSVRNAVRGRPGALSLGRMNRTTEAVRRAMGPGWGRVDELLSTSAAGAALGAAGEAVGQLNAGQEINWGDILAEAIGEYFTLPVEAASARVGVSLANHKRLKQAQFAARAVEVFPKILDAAKLSVLRQDAPNVFHQLVHQMGVNSGAREVYVSHQDLTQTDGLIEGLKQAIPTLAPKIDQAVQTGSDLTIPMADLTTQAVTDNSSLVASLKPVVRIDPEGMSFREAEAFVNSEEMQKFGQAYVNEAVRQKTLDTAFNDELNEVMAPIEAQFMAARSVKQTPDMVRASMRPYRAALGHMAALAGMSPKEFAARFPMTVARVADAASRAGSPVERDSKTGEPLMQGVPAKFAVGNNGNFDPHDANIYHQEAAAVDAPLKPRPAKGEHVPFGPLVKAHIGNSEVRRRAVEELFKLMSTEFQKEVVADAKGRSQVVYQKTINQRVQKAAKKAGIDFSNRDSKLIKELMVTIVVNDGLYAANVNTSAIGWYDEKVRLCLGFAGAMFPELDQHNKEYDKNEAFRFLYVLATTSNGLKVKENLPLAVRIYREYKRTGTLPAWGQGTQAEPMIKTIADFVKTQGTFESLDQMRMFFMTTWTVKQLELMGYDIAGEGKSEEVRGAAIIGPKIGNGFFANLNGLFDALTMDRWFMRTWGRWRGELVAFDPENLTAKVDRFRHILDDIQKKADGEEKAYKEAGKKLSDKELRARYPHMAFRAYLKKTGNFDIDAALRYSTKDLAKKEASLTAERGRFLVAVKRTAATFMPASFRAEYSKIWGGKDKPKSLGWRWYQAMKGVERAMLTDKVAPAGSGERAYIRSVFQAALQQLHGYEGMGKLSMADLQAALWYAEKKIYENTKSDGEFVEDYEDDKAPDYANVMRDVALKNGVPKEKLDQIEDRVKKEIANEGSSESSRTRYDTLGKEGKVLVFRTRGFGSLRRDRGLSVEDSEKQGQRSASVYRDGRQVEGTGVRSGQRELGDQPSRLDETGDRGSPDGRRVSLRVDPIATWKPGNSVSAVLKANQELKKRDTSSAAPVFEEFEANDQTAQTFLDALKEAKRSLGPAAACVEEKSIEELTGRDEWKSQCRIFLSTDRKCGFVIKNGDDLVSVFSGHEHNSGDAIVEAAIAAGARRLDCFNTILPAFYAAHGFRPVARLKFNRDYAPYDWDYDFFSGKTVVGKREDGTPKMSRNFSDGEPDIIMMVYDNDYDGHAPSKAELSALPETDGEHYGEPYMSDALKELEETNKVVEEAVNEARQRDAARAEKRRRPKVLNQPAYHGTPHNVNEFSTEYIGTGEGAQVHGWGLYFALNEDVARGYRMALTDPFDNRVFDAETGRELKLTSNGGTGNDGALFALGRRWRNADETFSEDVLSKETVRRLAEEAIESREKTIAQHEKAIADHVGNADFWRSRIESLRDRIAAYREIAKNPPSLRVAKGEQGHVYKVDIPEDAEMLNERLTMSQQPEKVRRALEGIRAKFGLTDQDMTGKELYRALVEKTGSPKAASLALLDAGIKGIRYDGKQDGPCAVVFSGDAVKILEFEQRQIAYNGSPNRFNRFSTEHIGEGQGARAHGWGLYFASSREIAEWYRRTYAKGQDGFNYEFEDGTSASGLWGVIDTLAERTGRESFSRDEIVAYLNERREFWMRQIEQKVTNGVKSAEETYEREKASIEQERTELTARIEELKENIKNADAEEVEDLQYELDGLYEERGSFTERLEEAAADFEQAKQDAQDTSYEESEIESIDADITRVTQGVKRTRAGRVYKTEIPGIEEMLDEDLEMDQQPKAIRQICEQIAKDLGITEPLDGMIGERFYTLLEERLGGSKAASLMLNERGIKGIHYIGEQDGECFVVFDDTAIEILEYWQDQSSGNRGSFDTSTGLMSIFSAADASTFIHESGHYFFNAMGELASEIILRPEGERTAGESELVSMMGGFLKWCRVEGATDEDRIRAYFMSGPDEQRRIHEQFARGYEAYTREGEAPTSALRRIFERFKEWLMHVYREASELNVEMNDEVRGLYARMFRTEAQAAELREQAQMKSLFPDAKSGGLSEEEWNELKGLYDEAAASVEAAVRANRERNYRMLANKEERVKRGIQKDYEQMENEVALELDALPVRQAERILSREGLQTQDGEVVRYQLFTGDLQGLGIGGQAISQLVDRGMATDRPDGRTPIIKPHLLADMLGAPDASELLTTLAMQAPREQALQEQTQQRFFEKYGDFPDEDGITSTAREQMALHSDGYAKALAAEYRALQRLAKVPASLARMTREAAARFAKQTIGKTQIRGLKPLVNSRAEAAASRESRDALGRSDFRAAMDAKRRQILQHFLSREGTAARIEVAKAIARVKRVLNSKTIHGSYMEQLENIAARFSLVNRDVNTQATPLPDFITKEAEENGYVFDFDEIVTSGVELPYQALTMEQFRSVMEAFDQLAHVGREIQNVTINGQRVSTRDAVAEAREILKANARSMNREPVYDWDKERPSKGAGLYRFLRNHVKVSTWCRIFDGAERGGFWWSLFSRRANECGDRETQLRGQLAETMTGILSGILSKFDMDEVVAHVDITLTDQRTGQLTNVPRAITRDNRLALALNWGNDGNRQRIRAGFGLTDTQVESILYGMTAEEWQAVEAIWKVFETLRPEMEALERRIYGRAPNWVEYAPFQVQVGPTETMTVSGGYYPIVYDRNVNSLADSRDAAKEAETMMRNAFEAVRTDRSHMKARAAKNNQPVSLRFTAVFDALNNEVHDLCWREFVIDAERLLRSGLKDTIRDYYSGDVARIFQNWVLDCAKGDQRARGIEGEQWSSWLRQGVGLAGLGFNIVSAVAQLTGIMATASLLGTATLRGVAVYARGPIAATRAACEESTFMANRGRTRFRELNEIANRIKGKPELLDKAQKGGYFLLLKVQQIVDTITWHATYMQAAEQGRNHETAVAMADQAVLDTQGGGELKDLSQIERGGPISKLFTVFYSFMNTAFNLNAAAFLGEKNRFKAAAQIITLSVILPVLEQMIRAALPVGGDDDDDDDPAEKTVKLLRRAAGDVVDFNLGTLMVAREVSNMLGNAIAGEPTFAWKGPAGTRVISDFGGVVQQVSQGEFDAALVKSIISLSGSLFGLPSAQINRLISTQQAVDEGKLNGPGEVVRGVLFGVQR